MRKRVKMLPKHYFAMFHELNCGICEQWKREKNMDMRENDL